MPSFKPIQLIPPGLLGLLQLKQEGRGIVELPDVLQGVLELRDWILQARAVWSGDEHSIVLNAAGRDTFETFTNPFGPSNSEWRYVHEYTIIATPVPAGGTAEIASFAPMMVAQNIGTLRPVCVGQPFVWGTGAPQLVQSQVIVSARNFFMPAGAVLGFAYGIVLTGAGTVDVSAFVRYTPLPN